MCGIFFINKFNNQCNQLESLAKSTQRRGSDASGLVYGSKDFASTIKSNKPLACLINDVKFNDADFIMGHSRLITNDPNTNQPVVYDKIALVHNGIITNYQEILDEYKFDVNSSLDSELIACCILHFKKDGLCLNQAVQKTMSTLKGVLNVILLSLEDQRMCFFSNNGSLYIGKSQTQFCVTSEKHTLQKLGYQAISKIKNCLTFPIEVNVDAFTCTKLPGLQKVSVPSLGSSLNEEALLIYPDYKLTRCTKCILPETMPFIKFDDKGVCNYCKNYKPRNTPKPFEQLLEVLEPYAGSNGIECLVPFSGGRDSTAALHIIKKELKLKPIAYTYDWGMVTDLGRRNISRVCSQLEVENIIVAANIRRKRENIRKNLIALLSKPDLGMMSLLTAGDKHFFRYIHDIKAETGIKVDLWGVNPLEVTHFKSGFLGIPPDFHEAKVYSNGFSKQINYQLKRFGKMMKNPRYINTSIIDTLTGEYYRSVKSKSDYFHIFDYREWDEKEINNILKIYDWELATDTPTTWRIGDGTAAFYNYVYFSMVGFTEHDTFRSNQIRENQISRELALELIETENQPRYPNIKWYLDALNLDYRSVIETINSQVMLTQ